MHGVSGIRGGVVGRAAVRAPAVQGGFVVAEAGAGRAEAAGGVGGVLQAGLLALQEAESGTVRDRQARRHGESLLEALRRLQVALLMGAGAEDLQGLRTLVEAAPPPDDPRLAQVQRAVLVRVAVELARRNAASSV